MITHRASANRGQSNTLRNEGLPVVCLHARHAKAALSLQLNKTDAADDAHGLAQLVRSGWYRAVAVNSLESYRLRAALTARARLVAVRTGLYHQIRGICKTFGVMLGPGRGTAFEVRVRAALDKHDALAPFVEPLLAVWRVMGKQTTALDRHVQRAVRCHAACRLLMTAPGVGAVTALAFVTGIDDPHRFVASAEAARNDKQLRVDSSRLAARACKWRLIGTRTSSRRPRRSSRIRGGAGRPSRGARSSWERQVNDSRRAMPAAATRAARAARPAHACWERFST